MNELQKKNARLRLHDAAWKDCTACRLCNFRRNTIFSYGNPNADLMFIGSNPSEEDDYHGLPMVGPPGEVLDIILANLNLSREDIFI